MKLEIPQNGKNQNGELINAINENIKIQLDNIIRIQSNEITTISFSEFENTLEIVGSLIDDCHTTSCFSGNKNKNFGKLLFQYQKLLIRCENYKIKNRLKEVNNLIETLDIKANELNSKQEKASIESSNLVYTILGFIASFSVITASVTAIEKLGNMQNIFLFIVFIIFILITTLIGLDNFYRKKDRKNLLQNNYFLWWVLLILIIIISLFIWLNPIISNLNQNKQNMTTENNIIK